LVSRQLLESDQFLEVVSPLLFRFWENNVEDQREELIIWEIERGTANYCLVNDLLGLIICVDHKHHVSGDKKAVLENFVGILPL
jgi:hypothetical protein